MNTDKCYYFKKFASPAMAIHHLMEQQPGWGNRFNKFMETERADSRFNRKGFRGWWNRRVSAPIRSAINATLVDNDMQLTGRAKMLDDAFNSRPKIIRDPATGKKRMETQAEATRRKIFENKQNLDKWQRGFFGDTWVGRGLGNTTAWALDKGQGFVTSAGGVGNAISEDDYTSAASLGAETAARGAEIAALTYGAAKLPSAISHGGKWALSKVPGVAIKAPTSVPVGAGMKMLGSIGTTDAVGGVLNYVDKGEFEMPISKAYADLNKKYFDRRDADAWDILAPGFNVAMSPFANTLEENIANDPRRVQRINRPKYDLEGPAWAKNSILGYNAFK